MIESSESARRERKSERELKHKVNINEQTNIHRVNNN